MKELGERIGRVEAGVAELRERVAYVEGVLEGLRDALVGRGPDARSPGPKPRRAGGFGGASGFPPAVTTRPARDRKPPIPVDANPVNG